MTTVVQVVLLLLLLVEPLLALAAGRHALRGGSTPAAPGREPRGDGQAPPADDLTVVVPLTGDPGDLDRVAWLHDQGARVLLVTTAAQSAAFRRRLWTVAGEHGFRVHLAGATQRAPGPPVPVTRAALLADAHAVLTSTYVVCVDPGTVVVRPLDDVVAAMVAAGADLATVSTSTAPGGLLARLARVEDVLAAPVRRRVPWLARGGVHVARRTVHADVLRHHAGLGPGDDAEPAVLAVARGYRVVHLDLPAVASEGGTVGAKLARRVAEPAGVFRLAVVNLPLGVRHPDLHLVAVAAAFALVPLLWWSVLHQPWALLPVVVLHGALTAAATRGLRDPVAWLYPLDALVRTFVLLPLGALAYTVAAVRAGRAGRLRGRDPWAASDAAYEPVLRRLPGPGPARATDWWARR